MGLDANPGTENGKWRQQERTLECVPAKNTEEKVVSYDDYFKFKSTHNIDQDLVCAQYNSVLSQLKISKKINDDIKTNILKSLKCTF